MACPTAQRVGTCGATIASLCPLRPFRTGSRLGGKKAQARMDTDFLDWALADFSGYVAADELYDGPFCILSAVDKPTVWFCVISLVANTCGYDGGRIGPTHCALIAGRLG